MPPEDATQRAHGDDLHLQRLSDATLQVVSGPESGRELRLLESRRTVGSGADVDLRLSDPRVSRRHFAVHAEADGVRLVDLGSRNGTRIGNLVVLDVRLTEDAVVTIGSTQIAVRLVSEPLEVKLSTRTSFGEVLGRSAAMRRLFALLEPASRSNVTVLLEGDSGTGKDVLARSLHQESAREAGPFVEVDCAAIPANLVEAELFGHERGAFTGAVASRAGAFERASGGTVFLDEVGELPLDVQPKLLRVLESRSFRRVGGNDVIHVDVRIVAATNRRLDEEVAAGRFREDLYYRLSVVHVRVPPLAQRIEDVGPLAETFLRSAVGDPDATVPPELLRLLKAYRWPGNARELRNVVERFATFREVDAALLLGRSAGAARAPDGSDMRVDLADLAGRGPYRDVRRRLVQRFEEVAFEAALREVGGSVSRAAERLGLPRATAYRLSKRIKSGQ